MKLQPVPARANNVVSAIVRVIVAAIALLTVYNLLSAGGPAQLLTFTLQSNTMVAVSFLWTAHHLVWGRRTPPEWLAGSAVFYLTITGIVYNFVLGTGDAGSPNVLFGLSNSDLEHRVTPIAALVIWIVFAEHRRIPWKFVTIWLYYLIGYLVAVLVLVAAIPSLHAPYSFLDVEALGGGGVAWRIAVYLAGFLVLSATMIGFDHLLPSHTPWGELDPLDQVPHGKGLPS